MGKQRSGAGSHGSLTKSGKIRDQNPRNWKHRRKTREGNPQKHLRKHKSPRVANRKRYEKMRDKPKKEFERMRRGFK